MYSAVTLRDWATVQSENPLYEALSSLPDEAPDVVNTTAAAAEAAEASAASAAASAEANAASLTPLPAAAVVAPLQSVTSAAIARDDIPVAAAAADSLAAASATPEVSAENAANLVTEMRNNSLAEAQRIKESLTTATSMIINSELHVRLEDRLNKKRINDIAEVRADSDQSNNERNEDQPGSSGNNTTDDDQEQLLQQEFEDQSISIEDLENPVLSLNLRAKWFKNGIAKSSSLLINYDGQDVRNVDMEMQRKRELLSINLTLGMGGQISATNRDGDEVVDNDNSNDVAATIALGGNIHNYCIFAIIK
jgi:hypothetical protein